MCGKPSTLTIKVRRLEWAGYLIRISDGRTVRKRLRGKQKERKLAGPKLRWLDCIENYMIYMGVQRRGDKTEDSSVWAIIRMGAVVKL
jgi:hypothetical protein